MIVIRRIATCVLTLLVLLCLLVRAEAATMDSRAGAVTTSSGNLNVRSGASASASKVASLKKGSYVTLISRSGSWWKVETLSSAQEINFREEPGENQPVICKIPEKTELKITEYQNGWGKTEYEGSSGWVMLHYLTPIKERK